MSIQSTLVRTAMLATALAATGMSFAIAQSGKTTSTAPRPSLFIITDQEGYGTAECLSQQQECGRIIADSFCESKGFNAVDFYRQAASDEVTGSIASERKPNPRDPQAFVISCK